MNRAVFLDRDGTLIAEKNYLHRPADVEIFPGAGAALKRLADAERVNEHLAREFARAGVCFEKVYIAPEAPDQPSRGRKPSPQFLFDARDEFGLDLAGCFMVGDKLIDLECGWNAGVKQSILVRTGYGAELERTSPNLLKRAAVVDDLRGVAEWILENEFKI